MIKFNLRDEKSVPFDPSNSYCWGKPFLAESLHGDTYVVICANGACIYFEQYKIISFSTTEFFTEYYQFIRFLTSQESVTFTGEQP